MFVVGRRAVVEMLGQVRIVGRPSGTPGAQGQASSNNKDPGESTFLLNTPSSELRNSVALSAFNRSSVLLQPTGMTGLAIAAGQMAVGNQLVMDTKVKGPFFAPPVLPPPAANVSVACAAAGAKSWNNVQPELPGYNQPLIIRGTPEFDVGVGYPYCGAPAVPTGCCVFASYNDSSVGGVMMNNPVYSGGGTHVLGFLSTGLPSLIAFAATTVLPTLGTSTQGAGPAGNKVGVDNVAYNDLGGAGVGAQGQIYQFNCGQDPNLSDATLGWGFP